MKEIMKGILSIVLVVLLGVLGFVIYGNYSRHVEQEQALLVAQATPEPTVTPSIEPTPEPAVAEPENAADVKLAVCGDLVCHT
ncbi:MAG: hypothetical protein EOM14_11265 [Clostridia bacterium]|nr:hypothetical protein [Clostridia bacterium]